MMSEKLFTVIGHGHVCRNDVGLTEREAAELLNEMYERLDYLINSGFEFDSDSVSQNIRSSIVSTLKKARGEK